MGTIEASRGAAQDLFLESRPCEAIRLELPDADIEYFPNFIPEDVRDRILLYLLARVNWKQEQIRYFGKLIDLPRLTAWYGDPGISYKYSGIQVQTEDWLPVLSRIRAKIEDIRGDSLNCVLLNLYRDQKDSVAWHSDNEPELGPEPCIASVSFGEPRTFQFRHKSDRSLTSKVVLTHGSLLIMRGTTQQFWEHQIPKTSRTLGKRVNLTFRNISPGG